MKRRTECDGCSDALEEAFADLAIKDFELARKRHLIDVLVERLRDANEQACEACADHIHKLEADNTRLEWECEKWRQMYYDKFAPPIPGLDK